MSLATLLAGLRRTAAIAATSNMLAGLPAASWRSATSSSSSLAPRRLAAACGRPRGCRHISGASL